MKRNKVCRGRALRIAVGITALVLLLAGGVGAPSDMNISPQSDINNRFIMHRLDAGITSHRDFGMLFRNQTGELTPIGLNAEYHYGRIPENRSLPPFTSIEKAAGMISATAGWFINDNATGGDCTSIGTWNAASKTCTVTTDLTETIEIGSDGINLDGNGHTITGSGYTGNGIYLSGRNGVTIKNTNVRNFYYGIYLSSSSNNTLSGNNASNNVYGIYLFSSSNNTLSGNNATNNSYGILYYSSNNNTVSGNNASNNYYGIYLGSFSNNNTVSGNNANSNNYYGIYLEYSSNNTLIGNNATNNSYGIYLDSFSNNNTVSGNNASSNNAYGIILESSSNNTLLNNTMTGNSYNFGLFGLFEDSYLSNQISYSNTIDYSNTVDGKPIYYVKNAKNTVYDSSTNAGTFYCIGCLNVTIKNMKLQKNGVGILFWNTTLSKIQNVNVSNNGDGIILESSSNNTLSGNNASNNGGYGIYLFNSNNNNTLIGNNANSNTYDGIYLPFSSSNSTLIGNNANSNNGDGIYLGSSGYNTLSGNNASNNWEGIELGFFSYTLSGNNASNNYYGIVLGYSSINKIYNNIFNNTNNIYFYDGTTSNTWNTIKTPGTNIIGGSYLGGNFWANPSGTGFSQTCADGNGDGICDSPYTLDSSNIDYLPLAYTPQGGGGGGGYGFDTGAGGYPSIMGTHNGTLKLNQSINVSKMYTYPSSGTGGHSEYVRIWNSTWNTTASWSGYIGDWHNITFAPVTLEANVTYNYTIRTGSYPQIIHNNSLTNGIGTITGSEFIDANGRRYIDWIPAIRLEK